MNFSNGDSSPPLDNEENEGEMLMLSPIAFLKLQFFLHVADSEVGGFGISRSKNLLYVDDFLPVRQLSSPVGVSIEPGAVAEHLAEMNAIGLEPDECARVWIQTRVGSWAGPCNGTERTFAQACAGCDWSVLLILSRTGRTYARLQFMAGPKMRKILQLRVGWAAWSQMLVDPRAATGNPQEDWMNQYLKKVRVESGAEISVGSGESELAQSAKLCARRLLPILVPIVPTAVD